MQKSDNEVDFSKVSFRNSNSNTNLTIYADIENIKNLPGSRFQVPKSLRTKITPKSVVESVTAKLKSLQASDSLKNRQRNQKSLHGCSKSHHNVNLINKPVYAANKFETQDISASQLVKAIDNAEELHKVDSKGYTQEFDVSFQDDKFIKLSNINDLEITDAVDEPEFVKSNLNNLTLDELELSQHSNYLSFTPAERKTMDEVPCLKTVMKSNNICKETLSFKTQRLHLFDNIENSPNSKNINENKIEAECNLNKIDSDSKSLNETYCIAREQKPDPLNNYIFGVNNMNDDKNNANDDNITELQVQYIKDKLSITEITPSPVFTIATKQETELSPHIICNLVDFEKFEKLVSFKEYCTDETLNNDVCSQILGGNENVRASSDEVSSIKYIDDILESSDSLSADDKAQLESILHNNDSNNLNLSPVLQTHNIKVKLDTEVETLQTHCDMELTCEDTVVNIIDNKTNIYSKNNSIDVKEDVSKAKNNNNVLEDDILFSSDEENEYIKKELNELPLTCALETSFYTNQSDILDKTMFVGFQTASNNYISISTDSFCKAKTMMDDIDYNLSPSLIELVDMCEKSALDNTPDNDAEKTDQNTSKSVVTTKECIPIDSNKEETFNIIETANEPAKNCNFTGFKTASNKHIDFSEKSRQRITKVFQDIDLTDDFTKEENNRDSAIIDKELIPNDSKDANKENTNVCILTDPNDLFTEIEFTDTEMIAFDEVEKEKVEPNSNLIQSKFEGFKTASNKAISVSEKALQMSEKVFENIDNNEVSSRIVGNTGTKNNTEDHVFKKPESPMRKTKNLVPSFKMASNKTVNDPNNALRVGIHNIDVNTEIKTELPKSKAKQESSSEKFDGFRTASNKRIIISEKALEQSNKLFEEIEINCNESLKLYKLAIDNVPSSLSFKTANNKPIQISNKTIEKCRKVFENIDSLEEIIPNSHIKHEKDKVYPDQSQYQESTSTKNNLAGQTKFIGFQTANNKSINISKKSLEKTKYIFDDLNDFELITNDNNSNKQVIVSYDDSEISKADNLTNEAPFVGFQTASNKMINISEQLLAKTKHIFENIDDIKTEHIYKKNLSKEQECITVNKNKEIESTLAIDISEKDLNMKLRENTVEDENYKYENTDKSLKRGFQGFQTASNKKVKVSDESLAQTKDIFNNIINHKEQQIGNKLEVNFKGFQTASNKKIVVSKDPLAKTKEIFQDIPENIDNIVESDSLTTPKFAGFQTGNKIPISVSEEALKNSKKVFDNIIDTEIVNVKSNSVTTPKFSGFQTGNKKSISVSEEALKNSKKVFDSINNEKIVNNSDTANAKRSKSFGFCFQNANQKEIQVSQKAIDTIRHDERNNSRIKTPENHTTNDTNLFLDTQAISNFENTLFTEDFCKDSTPIQPKRSGSPILSCPKAKKRKSFQTPYKTEKSIKNPRVIDKVKEIIDHTVYEFNDDYKKNKTVNLKMLQKLEEESENTTKIDKKITEINFETILNFTFKDERSDIPNSKLTETTVEDLKTLFLESIDKKIVPEGWIENHLKLILWKLFSYEVMFPKVMNKICTAKNAIDQLKYRYDRELYNVERPPLRKILEKDELASKCIVLCVVNLIQDGSIVESKTDINKTIELTLTDGWYCVKASIDKMLSKLVYDGRIVVGCKIITHGAELVNCDQGKSPLEDISEVRLKISGNSTRLVRWHTKLGLCGTAAILSRLSNVKVDGGKVSKLRLFVTRVYPMLYVEKFDDGSTVTRSEKLEQQYQNKYEMQRQSLMEKLYEEIERELSDEDSQDSIEYKEPLSKRRCLDSGSQIARAMKRCKDPVEFRSNLTESQVHLLNDYTNKHRDRILQQIQTKIRDKMEKSGSNCVRNVVPLLKVRVSDVCVRNGDVQVCQGYISIWRPNEAVSEIINEGQWIDVLNALPTAYRSQEIQLTAGRQTVFSKITPKLDERISLHTKKLLRHCKEIKDLVKNPNEYIDYNEIDTIGIVTEIDPPNSNFGSSGRQFQNIYLADLEKNIICINFWGGIKKFGYENIVDTGQCIYGRNLQKRVGNTRKSIPQFRVTEFSMFTKTPKNIIQRNFIDNFVKTFNSINKKQFCDDCSLIRRRNESNKYNLNLENISPFRMNNSDCNLSKNRQYFESPLAQNHRKEDEFRLTGLDFESTFKQTDTQNMSPELLKKKQLAQAKIAKLKMYGEPPPLGPIHILNKSKMATAAYKSPLINATKSMPTVSPKTTNEFLPLVDLVENRSSSPVFCLNETYTKKSINPVKLNFNVDSMNVDIVDNFDGEFDGSPPLSLD